MSDILTSPISSVNTTFLKDVLAGLSAPAKHLSSKYFYDARGDLLFQKIMHCPEYYLTRCELDILQQQSGAIADTLLKDGYTYDIVELGAGDATKSIHLLRALLQKGGPFTYYPVDISANVISLLEETLPPQLPGMTLRGLNGDYFNMLGQWSNLSDRPKLVLFMGANIGNMTPVEATEFCKRLHSYLNAQDKLIIGFDLRKDPRTILAAYNDAQGFTRDFNLNILHRINRELDADFNIDSFLHYPVYDPGTGACKSYLISLRDQSVTISGKVIHFTEYEPVYTEISQKYAIPEIEKMALESGFEPYRYFYDSLGGFADVMWKIK